MKKLFLILAVTTLFFSCKKSTIDKTPELPSSPLITTAGTPDGTPSSKLIKAAAGGSITSADGRITVKVPAAAFSSDQMFIIQPITNNTGFGIGKAYRLTPEGTTFNKPVTISFNYTDAEVTGATPELLSIAYQDNAGAWQSMNQTQVNTQQRQLTVTTTHFSDWGFFPLVYIEPGDARVEVNETVDLKVMYAIDPADADLFPAPIGNTPLTQPIQINPSYIKKWNYNGTGALTPNGSKAVYKAPGKAPLQNPEAVNAEINFRKKETYLLVSNITVLSDFHID